jgi:hypothetical protein
MGSVLLAGLLSGCGGAVVDEGAEPSTLESREDALPSCNGQDYERIFYSEPEKINEVGWWYCYCGDSSAWIYGRTTAYSSYTYKTYCG